MSQFLRPNNDVANTWSNNFSAIDEATASDADFVYSGNNPNGSGAEFGLSNPASTPQSGTCTVRYREIQLNGTTPSASGTAVSLEVQVFEGATLIASSGAHTLAIATWRAGSYTFSASSVTNWDDLRVKFVASGGGGSPSNRRGAGVSWVELEIPDGLATITGTMSAQESGSDVLSATGTASDPVSTGTMFAIESGQGTFSGQGQVAVSGVAALVEDGNDSFSSSGFVAVSGQFAAQEVGGDSFAASGQVADTGLSGSMTATESGSDGFAGGGLVFVQGSMEVRENGQDIFAASGSADLVAPGPPPPVIGSAPTGGSFYLDPKDAQKIYDVLFAKSKRRRSQKAKKVAQLEKVAIEILLKPDFAPLTTHLKQALDRVEFSKVALSAPAKNKQEVIEALLTRAEEIAVDIYMEDQDDLEVLLLAA